MNELETCLFAIRDWIKAEDNAQQAAAGMSFSGESVEAREEANKKRREAVDALRNAINATRDVAPRHGARARGAGPTT